VYAPVASAPALLMPLRIKIEYSIAPIANLLLSDGGYETPCVADQNDLRSIVMSSFGSNFFVKRSFERIVVVTPSKGAVV
jgi:hypothetical protein